MPWGSTTRNMDSPGRFLTKPLAASKYPRGRWPIRQSCRDCWIYLFNQMAGGTALPVIWRMRPDGLRQELIAHLPVACRFGFVSMSGDGRRLVCAVHRLEPDLWLVSDFNPDT